MPKLGLATGQLYKAQPPMMGFSRALAPRQEDALMAERGGQFFQRWVVGPAVSACLILDDKRLGGWADDIPGAQRVFTTRYGMWKRGENGEVVAKNCGVAALGKGLPLAHSEIYPQGSNSGKAGR